MVREPGLWVRLGVRLAVALGGGSAAAARKQKHRCAHRSEVGRHGLSCHRWFLSTGCKVLVLGTLVHCTSPVCLGLVENGVCDRQFGARVRDLRGDAITQEQVAYLGGFSVSTVSRSSGGCLVSTLGGCRILPGLWACP